MGTSTVETELHALIDEMNAAWGDADAYGAVFTEDADYVTFFGGRARGRQEIIDSHRPLFEGAMRNSRLEGRIDSFAVLSPDVALVHTAGGLRKGKGERPSHRAGSVQTMVAVKDGERWRIRAFQNTKYQPLTAFLTNRVAPLMAKPGR
ncbi:SgcJ/EcaC family oxidoreductase [Amycolatopsis taiwanensis]|uniref:SgcJ/EcaC family oxidoreductase n=1 Tax=Amycolatopsis taiwanensis TaxID=342230 RepID=UPI0004AE5CA0|nr:SgcJ/EcaC family oxidoreductase [Amycolatopsis taiwanensis]